MGEKELGIEVTLQKMHAFNSFVRKLQAQNGSVTKQ